MKKTSDFVNHHMHSFFSSLDGMPSPEDIMERVVDLGQRSFTITDHGSLSAIPAAYRAAKEADIGFTPGIEAYFTHDRFNKHKDKYGKDYYHMILLAQNNTGYKNLLKMQTPSWEEGLKGKYPRVDYEVLAEHHEGLTVTTACLGSAVNQHILHGNIEEAKKELDTLIEIFGIDNVYIEVQNHHQKEDKIVLQVLLDFHKQSGAKLLATSDSHYCLPGDYEAHDALLAMSTKSKKHDEKRFTFVNDEFYIPSKERMEEILPPEDFPGAIFNTVELAEKTDFTLEMGDKKKYLMPHIDVLPGKTESETLRGRVYKGAQDVKRYGDVDGNIPDEVKERIDYELGVISGMNFDGYFIIVADMIEDFAKNGIRVGPGRGCLHEDTKILTEDGWKEIKKVTTDDVVMSGNGKWCGVYDVIRHDAMPGEKLVKLSVSNGTVLRLTEKHKVLIYNSDTKENVWTKAACVSTGDNIAYVHDDVITYNSVVSVDKVTASETIYDLTVDKGDPSFLTESGTVHNSAPGSVIVYCLGITDVDPFEHDLFFERFLNPDRISMPDIDVDVPNSRRAECLSIMEERYGKGHVAHLSNYTTMGRKDTLNRVAKVYSVSVKFSEYMDAYCDVNGLSLQDVAKIGMPQEVSSKKEFNGVSPSTLDTVLQVAARLEGTLASYGVHASGIVVTSSPIDENFPIRISKKAQLPVSQYDGHDVEDLGGIKIDILGLINLDQCEDAERNILLDLGEEIDSANVPHDDPEVYKMLSSGDGGGVFQLGCLAGDTVIDGVSIKELFLRKNSPTKREFIRSVFLGEGVVRPHRVKDVVYSGQKTTYVLKTEKGKSIRATADHKFFTDSGWKKLADITTSDHVVSVDDETGFLLTNENNVRGVEDIMTMYSELHDGIIPMHREKISTGENTFTPDFRGAYPNHNDYCTIVVDSGYEQSKKKAGSVNADSSKMNLTVKSYHQVAEEYFETKRPKMGDFLLPAGAYFDKVDSIAEHHKEETFDVMMHDPVHNFVANGLMVHNSSGMQSLMKVLQPQEFKDISALIALYRPGPMGMDTHNEYARRKNRGAEQSVPHPDMEDVLKKNYNLIVYQEDIMALARLLAGYTGGEADTLRKATAKKNPKMMKEQEEKFIPAVNNRYGNHLGDTIWEMIKPFGAYAFNKCLHGRTRVVLDNGKSITVKELFDSGEFAGKNILSMWEDGSIRPHSIKDVVKVGRKPVFTIRTKKGRTISITEDHRMLTVDGYKTISDGGLYVGQELLSDDNTDGSKKVYVSDEDRLRRSEQARISGSTPQLCIDNMSRDRCGLGIRTEISDGRVVDSMTESLPAEYLLSRGIDFELHKVFISTNGTARVTDFYADGIYFEMDGMNRGRQWFVDNKYGEDIPFVYMTLADYKDKIDEAIMKHHITNGDEIIEIIEPKRTEKGEYYTEMTYDIEMQDNGPANFIANGLVSHNSHSVAYGFTTYRTAWLKAHYPAQFAASVIDNTKNADKLLPEFVWMRKAGLKIYSPDVNNSDLRSITTRDSVQLPIHLIKGIGYDVAKSILDERVKNGDYKTVVDFVARNNINERNMVLMAKAGCFDTLGASRAAVVCNKGSILSAAKQQASKVHMKTGLFGGYYDDSGIEDEKWTGKDAEPSTFVIDGEMVDVDELLLAQWEKESMGVLVGPHPFEMIRKYPKGQKLMKFYPPITDYTRPNSDIQAIGFMTDVVVRSYTNKRGEKKFMTKYSLETDEGVVPAVMFEAIDSDKLPAYENQFVYVEGKLENDTMESGDDSEFSPNLISYTIKPLNVAKIMQSGEG